MRMWCLFPLLLVQVVQVVPSADAARAVGVGSASSRDFEVQEQPWVSGRPAGSVSQARFARTSGTRGLPLHFEANVGQTDSDVEFLARGSGHLIFLARGEAVFTFRSVRSDGRTRETTAPADHWSAVTDAAVPSFRMKLLGANADPQGVGQARLGGQINYFRGKNEKAWRTGVPAYDKVMYREVYPGIDLVYYGNSGRLEYDFVVAPGSNPGAIALSFEGADSTRLDGDGNLVLSTGYGSVRFEKPLMYQESNGSRQSVTGRYLQRGEHLVGFEVDQYDAALPLVIDPVLSYSTYLGGNDYDAASDIAVDATGAAYVTGVTVSPDFPLGSPGDPDSNGDTFVAKLTPDGTTLAYLTYIGGSDGDLGGGIVVDASGAAYLAGWTYSPDFPTTTAAFQPAIRGDDDAFIVKMAPDGTIVYATYLGGDGDEGGTPDIAVDTAGAAYVIGQTSSSHFPTRSPLQPAHAGEGDAFVAKLSPDGASLVYATYLGGSEPDNPLAIVVDASGSAYITGITESPDFPTERPLQPTYAGDGDVFVAKLAADGTALTYATYLGGSLTEFGADIAVDAVGSAYVTGGTGSPDFPMRTTLQAQLAGSSDAFVAKLNAVGAELVYATYLGGSGPDRGTGIAVDSDGSAVVAGEFGGDFLLVHPTQPARGGSQEIFVTRLTPDGAAIVYSAGLGGAAFDDGASVALDRAGAAFVTGTTFSLDWPTFHAMQPAAGSIGDAFVVKLAGAATDVPVTNVNAWVRLREDDLVTSFDPSPVSATYPAGTFVVTAAFENSSGFAICDPFFQVVELSSGNHLQAIRVVEPGDIEIQGSLGYPVAHPSVAVAPGTTISFDFTVYLRTRQPFTFLVSVWGTLRAPGDGCP